MIEFQNVSFSYPDSTEGGLKHIDLTIPDGQCVLLCGRSGCGKTTLTRLINGLIPQFFVGELSGQILLDGENLADLPMYRIAEKVGSVFQNPRTQFFNVDTDSEIAFGMENEAVPKEQMEKRVAETAKALHILTAPELSRPKTDTETPHDSTLALHNVHFGYNDTEVLHGIDLTFREGTVNALVGPSGSGKSTIAKLIASFWDVNSGSITVGGADIRHISAAHYHRLVAYVSQDNFLFDSTVRENIRMGRPDATDAEVEQAAKDCGCYEFIMSLENGFDTVVGSGGGHLSGGEKQRICIARAMLKNAPIVILDEATAYTDPENEAIIQESVARLVRGKTLIVIAHRLSTITDADQIAVVNDGRIEAAGTQAELLQSCPLYHSLWDAHIASRDSAEGGADRA